MKRKDRILEYMKQEQRDDVTTEEIATALDIQRSNASRDLNILVREGKVKKTTTRPVHYGLVGVTDQPQKTKQTNDDQHIFDCITGSEGSMKTQIEQAKSSILYPPKGLNCLITGQTGTGKTLFVHTMFQFAKAHHLIAEDKTLTVFNCADYANNTELLMSHLFGYVKGAFTGADKTTDGLIQQADGGMLFLDEVHRLPPEGQEMIFYFMDHGTYSRLGEVDKNNHADVRVVCATTDDPNSSLLATFTRRIPITIHLPSFHERPAREQINLLKTMLQLEASRISRRFEVSEEVAKALIGSVEYGNVGQLKSNVQLVCARGFLNYMDTDTIPLTLDLLTPQIRDGLVKLKSNRPLYLEISRRLESTMLIAPTDNIAVLSSEDSYELPYNLYDLIDHKATLLKEEGMDKEAINNFIMTDINIHMKSFYQHHDLANSDKKLRDIVDPSLIEMTKDIQSLLETQYQAHLSHDFVYAMSLHLSSFIKRMEMGEEVREVAPNIMTMVQDYPQEFAMAQRIKAILENNYQLIVPESELYYLATLLISLQSSPQDGKIGIVVATHGNSTATSMVQVVSQLLGVDHLTSFDMSLDMSPKEAFEGICDCATHVDRGNGVLLLVDMGSLATFNQQIREKTGIEVRTIDMVTTAMVLEAGRKTTMANIGLDSIYDELRRFKGYSHHLSTDIKENATSSEKKRAILTLCSSGEGTAKQIEKMMNDILVHHLIDDIEVIPASFVNHLDETIEEVEKNYTIVGTVGAHQTTLPVPHLSIESLLQGGGDYFVDQLEENQTSQASHTMINIEMVERYVEEYYTFINAHKIVPLLWDYCDKLDENDITGMSAAFRVSFISHVAGAIERVLRREPLVVEDGSVLDEVKNSVMMQEMNEFLQENLNISLPLDELYYILQIIDTEKEHTNKYTSDTL